MGVKQSELSKIVDLLIECQCECDKLKKIEMQRVKIDFIDDRRRETHRIKENEFIEKLKSIKNLQELETFKNEYIEYILKHRKIEDEYEKIDDNLMDNQIAEILIERETLREVTGGFEKEIFKKRK